MTWWNLIKVGRPSYTVFNVFFKKKLDHHKRTWFFFCLLFLIDFQRRLCFISLLKSMQEHCSIVEFQLQHKNWQKICIRLFCIKTIWSVSPGNTSSELLNVLKCLLSCWLCIRLYITFRTVGTSQKLSSHWNKDRPKGYFLCGVMLYLFYFILNLLLFILHS